MDDLQAMIAKPQERFFELERTGVLFGSGPFLAEGGIKPGSGTTILRAASREEAASLAERAPFYKAGMRSFEVRTWKLNEGSFTVRIDYYSGDYAVE